MSPFQKLAWLGGKKEEIEKRLEFILNKDEAGKGT